MKVTVITQYSIFLPNKPGALARLAGLFSQAGVNMVGIASEVRDDSGLVRVALEGEGDHSAVLSRAGFASVENKLLSVEVSDKPGQLAVITSKLAAAGVNITTVYGTAFGHQVSRILIAVDKVEPALKALEGA
ncbi:MAG: ACT domain-containing protein [Elusimicrobia bacterium]|nr:ACT domain-containing protein [Elusimicrobiota bacterium]